MANNKTMEFGVDILPVADSTYDIGSNNNRYNNIYTDKINGDAVTGLNATDGFGRGTCSTAAATAAKVATLSGYELKTGGIVSIRFSYAVPASATLSINGKAAKDIYYRNAAITAGKIKAGDTATFIYDGTRYHVLAVDSAASHSMTWGDLYST